MKRRLLKTLAAVLAIAAAAAGPVRGQNASPDVTLDFTTNDWGIPEGKANKAYDAHPYTSGDYTITLQGGGGSSNGYYFNSGYLMLGKSGAYLELPEFSSPVEKIEVVGNSAASDQVKQNIYVGETAVSTQTTGAKGTNTYVINENYRAAGNIYTLRVESAQNTQITYIKVYYVSSGGGSTPEPNQTTYNVTFGGFGNDQLNTMYEDQSLPLQLTFDAIDISEQLDGVNEAYVDDGAGAEEIGVTYGPGSVTVTINSAFNGTATIIVDDYGNYEAYLYVTVVSNAPAPTPHTVRFASGNDGWTVQDVTASASATAPAVLQNVMAGDSLVVTAPATLPGKVKSVKAVKYVAPAATVTTAPTATEAYIAASSTSALVNAGAANGGTMMYAVTTTNAQPASTDGFSATIPTAQGRTAGTYYVWYYAQADADHSDSEIAGPVSVTLATIVTINQSDWGMNSITKDGVTVSAGEIDPMDGNLMEGGTFSTTLGNFTRIVVTTFSYAASGTGWSGGTWAGTPASTVSFSGSFMGISMSQTTIVCTIVPTN